MRIFFLSLSRKGTRLLSAGVKICLEKPLLFPAAALFITILGAGALFVNGVDVSEAGSGDSIYARVEFEGGFHREEGDKLLASWAGELKKRGGIVSVQTSVRTGSAQVLVNFDPAVVKEDIVRTWIRSSGIPGGFVYIPETAANERNWEITISGDDDEKCRELAEQAAGLCAALPLVRDAVLNFKQGNPRLSLLPRRERFAGEEIAFSTAADTVRRGLYGPVIYKRLEEKGETDVRLRLDAPSGGPVKAADILDLPLIPSRPSPYGIAKLDASLVVFRDNEPSVIRRENRRRVASFSLRTASMDPRKVRDVIMKNLESMELPRGYAVEFDRDAVTKAEELSGTVFRFFLALVFCYMIIAAVNESFHLPYIVLAAVPPSLAVPVLVLIFGGSSINSAVCCSLVALSGIAVNASVITAGEFAGFIQNGKTEFKGSVMEFYRAVRRCLPCLFGAAGTTMAGALPFLFLRDASNSLVRVLSIVSFIGVGVSLFFSLALVPSLVTIICRFRQKEKSPLGILQSKSTFSLYLFSL